MFLHVLKTLARYARFYKANLFIVAISLISVSFSLLTIGSIFKNLVDNGLTNNNVSSINNSILLICCTICVFGISSFFRSYFINLVAEKIIIDIKTRIYNHLMNCEVVQFEDMKIGDLISRFGYDTEQVAKLIINFFSFFLRNSVMLIGSIALMFAQSPKLSIIVLVSIPILLFPLLKLSKYVRKLSRSTADFQGTLAANIDESFSNIRIIHAYNLQQDRIDNFTEQTKEFLVFSKNRLKSRSLFFALAISAILFSITLVLWIGSRDIINGNISSGQIISFIYFALIAGISGGGIAELFSEMQLPLASANRIFSLLEIPVAKDQANDNLPHISHLIIEFDNVSFTYPTRNSEALKNISFKIDCKFTGIVGASGSGKSTIMQLLMKFYQSNSGIIKINRRNIDDINTNSIRELISYVPQDPKIFSGSIFYNITIANSKASIKEVQKIAEITGIKFFADKLKDGLHTEIGEKGVKLSGGQKQRIALARALLRNTEILLLDEATSSLDINDETQLFENIADFIKNKKIIWIAHRMSSLQNAEQILVIKDGKLLFQGNNSEFTNQKQLHQALSVE